MFNNQNKDVKIIRTKNTWIESAAVDQLNKVSELSGIISAAGMPDLHPGKTPVGVAYKTQNKVYPHIIGNDIGCGIALFGTSLKKHKFNLSKVRKKYSKYDHLSDIDISINEDLSSFPLTDKLGTIGSGNHFGEFQSIEKVYDQDLFESLGLSSKEIYLLVHSGSRNYGDYILENVFKGNLPKEGINTESDLFKDYMGAHQKALDFSKLNRQIIARRILSQVQNDLPKLMFESVHNAISYEKHDGAMAYIHRKGAAPSNIGPIVIAGTRETQSFIVLPSPGVETYLNSISHGAGRKWHRSGCKDRLINKYGKKNMKKATPDHLICNNNALYYEEAPEAYKNISQVIEDLVDHKLVQVVASLTPLLTIKI